MIVVDTSALIAVLRAEATGDASLKVLETAERLVISAATITEALIVAARKDVLEPLELLFAELELEIAPLTPERARAAGAAYRRRGKGFHPARLNFGDCFAHALAIEHACPLLYIGKDFAQTDIVSAL